MTRRRQLHAFTLLELILVMMVILLMASLVAPALQRFSTSRDLDNQAVILTSMAGYARTQAMAQSRTYRLNLDEQDGKFWLSDQDELPSPFEPAKGDEGQPHTLPQGVKVALQLLDPAQDQANYVTFNPDGRVDPAIIVLTDPAGRKITIAAQTPTEFFQIVQANGLPAGATP